MTAGKQAMYQRFVAQAHCRFPEGMSDEDKVTFRKGWLAGLDITWLHFTRADDVGLDAVMRKYMQMDKEY